MSKVKNILDEMDRKRAERLRKEALRPVVLRHRWDNQMVDAISIAQCSFETSQSFYPVAFEDRRNEYSKFVVLTQLLEGGARFVTNKAAYVLDGKGDCDKVMLPRTWRAVKQVFSCFYESDKLSIYSQAINLKYGRIDSIKFPACLNEQRDTVLLAFTLDTADTADTADIADIAA